MARDTNLLL